MARQIIFVRQETISTLAAHTSVQADENSVSFHVHPIRDTDKSLAIRASLSEFGCGSAAPAPLRDFVLALTSMPEPDARFQPVPLPDDIVHLILEQFEAAVGQVTGEMSGHDQMELAEAFDAAHGSTEVWPTLRRQPNNAYETDLVTAAIDAQAMLQSRLVELDRRHVALREATIRQRMVKSIRALSRSGPLADALHLATNGSYGDQSGINSFYAKAVMDGLKRAKTDHAIYSHNLVRHLKQHELFCAELRPFWLLEVFEAVLPHRARSGIRFLWRSEERALQFGPSIAVADIEEAMLGYFTAFDGRLLGDVHPVIRAALAMHELMRIEPAADENPRIAGYIFASMLDTCGFFALPLPLLLHRRMHCLESAFSDAQQVGRPDGFIREAVLLYEKAIKVGEHMMTELLPWHARTTAHLTTDGLPANNVSALADKLTMAPLIERVQLSCVDRDDWRDLGPSLHAAGFLDRLEIDGELWWSPTLPRELVVSRAIWPICD
jgi:hypothetical protein